MAAEPFSRPDPEQGRGDVRFATQDRPQPLPVGAGVPCRILVTGGEGFLGSHLIPRLLGRGHRVRATYRDPEGPGMRTSPGIEWRSADLSEPDAAQGLAEDCDAVVHLAGLFAASGALTLARVHGTATRNIIAEAERAGVARLVHVSVLGARPGDSDYYGTKFDAETAVVSCDVASVILRPSVIYGPGDSFTSTIVRLLRLLPAFPMPGGGRFRLQPLAVEDMVDALTQCVERDDLDGREFDVAGPEPMAFRDIVRIVGEVVGIQRPMLPLPERMVLSGAGFIHRIGLPAPFTPEQLAIFATGSVLPESGNPLLDVFHVKPLPFRDAVRDYLESGR